MNQSSKPVDLLDKLVSNHNAGKPLLEGAVLYRGTRLPDQALGHFGKELHTSLLPQVAASYTHNWKTGGQAYIGAYPVDRETTKFYPDFGMEKTGSAAPKAYSVADVEKALAPLVNNLATAKTTQDKAKAEQHIESLLKTSFYEAGVPAKTASGEPTRPQTLYAYEGRPDTSMRQAVTMQMTPMSPAHEKTARLQMLTEHKSPSMQQMVDLLAVRNAASPAISVLASVAARDHAKDLMNSHATKPLGQLIQDIARHPTSDMQDRLSKFAQALHAGVGSQNSATQQKAVMMAAEVSKLNPDKATFSDIVAVSAMVRDKVAASQSNSTSQDFAQGVATASRAAGAARDMGGSFSATSGAHESGVSLATSRGNVGGSVRPSMGSNISVGMQEQSSGTVGRAAGAARDIGGSFSATSGAHESGVSRASRPSDLGGSIKPTSGSFSAGVNQSSQSTQGGIRGIDVGGSRGSSGEASVRLLGEQAGRTQNGSMGQASSSGGGRTLGEQLGRTQSSSMSQAAKTAAQGSEHSAVSQTSQTAVRSQAAGRSLER